MRSASVWLLALLVGCDQAPQSGALPTSDVRPASAYDALPLRSLAPDAPLCAVEAARCLMPSRGLGTLSDAGDAAILVAGTRRPIVAFVRRGGREVVVLGRDGDGPGEYRYASLVNFAPNGDVLIFDFVSRRQVRFAASGAPLGDGLVTLPPAPVLSGSGFAFVGGELRMLAAERPDAEGDTLPVHLFALDPGSSSARRLHALALSLPAYGLGESQNVPRIFAPKPETIFRDDGRIVIARGDRLELDIFDSAGRHERRVGFDMVGRAVTPEDIDALRQVQVRNISDPQMREAYEREYDRAASRHPAVTRLVAMSSEETWVRQAPDAANDSVSWLVLDRNLLPVGRVRTGVRDEPIGLHAGRYLIARSGDDEATTGYWWMRSR